MALDRETAKAAVLSKMQANGAEVEALEVVQKGTGVWMAIAQLKDEEVERQGIFTDDELASETHSV